MAIGMPVRRNKTAETRARVKIYFIFLCSQDWSYNKRKQKRDLTVIKCLVWVCLHRLELEIEIAKVKIVFEKLLFTFYLQNKRWHRKRSCPLAA